MITETQIILSEKGFSYTLISGDEVIHSHLEELYFPNYKKAFSAACNRSYFMKKDCLDILKKLQNLKPRGFKNESIGEN